MADDKQERGARDRAEVSGEEGYEVEYFARKHGIAVHEARRLIDKVGNNREELDAAAERFTGRAPGG